MRRSPTLLIAGLLLITSISCGRRVDAPAPWIAETSAEAEILRTLQWYTRHAVGALKPPDSYLVRVSENDPQAVHSSLLREAGLLDESYQQIRVAPAFRSHVRISANLADGLSFTVSPFEYRVDRIAELKEEMRDFGPVLVVRFTLTSQPLSPLVSLLERIPPSAVSPAAHAPQLSELGAHFSRSSDHTVEFIKNLYGYVLSVGRDELDD